MTDHESPEESPHVLLPRFGKPKPAPTLTQDPEENVVFNGLAAFHRDVVAQSDDEA